MRSAKKRVREAEVVNVQWLTPALVRVSFTGEDLRDLPELDCTDHYIKFFFPPAAVQHKGSLEPESMPTALPREEALVTRTYTIRSFNRETNVMLVDFVVHGADGLAGPWAATVASGARITFRGPGGKFRPDATADTYLLVGDEAAIPAIAAALEALPVDAVADVFIEVDCDEYEMELPSTARTTVTWVHRHDRSHGVTLADAVRNAPFPSGKLQAFVHGNAHMVKDLRRYLFVERGLDRSQVSISGYWRTDHTEDDWQASKHEFVAAMEADEAASGRG